MPNKPKYPNLTSSCNGRTKMIPKNELTAFVKPYFVFITFFQLMIGGLIKMALQKGRGQTISSMFALCWVLSLPTHYSHRCRGGEKGHSIEHPSIKSNTFPPSLLSNMPKCTPHKPLSHLQSNNYAYCYNCA